MPTVQLTSTYSVDLTTALSPAVLKSRYLFGIPLVTPRGELIDDEIIDFYIRVAQNELERFLQIKLTLQVVSEGKQFHDMQYGRELQIRAYYPVVKPLSLSAKISNQDVATFDPATLIVPNVETEGYYSRNIRWFPWNATFSQVNMLLGIFPNYPHYNWTLRYVSGYATLPLDLLAALGKLAAINVLVYGDVLGNMPLGAASTSLSLDGISQSVSSINSAKSHALSARLNQYAQELERSLPMLTKRHKGIVFRNC